MLRGFAVGQDEANVWSGATVSFAHPYAVGWEGDGVFEETGVDRGPSADEVCDVDRDVDEGVRTNAGRFDW